uniref:Uncharacterized protein n=1 Tax=Aegilops tauschii subsp. strangulata TaxID=200361 RepID=A0A453PFX8_AEGTS
MGCKAAIRWRWRSAATSIRRRGDRSNIAAGNPILSVCVLLHPVLEESGAHQRPSSNGGKPSDGGWADSDTGLTPESRVAAFARIQGMHNPLPLPLDPVFSPKDQKFVLLLLIANLNPHNLLPFNLP